MLTVALFLSVTITAHERKEYTQVDDDTYKVKIYNTFNGVEYLQQVGTLDIHNGKLIPCGVWVMYDSEGDMQARAMYVKGKRAWFERDMGDRIVLIQKKRAK